MPTQPKAKLSLVLIIPLAFTISLVSSSWVDVWSPKTGWHDFQADVVSPKTGAYDIRVDIWNSRWFINSHGAYPSLMVLVWNQITFISKNQPLFPKINLLKGSKTTLLKRGAMTSTVLYWLVYLIYCFLQYMLWVLNKKIYTGQYGKVLGHCSPVQKSI